ncbi:MAG: PEGA domain-containing protein [Kiritimatiellales bacterium]
MTFRSLLNFTLMCFSLALIALFTGCAAIVSSPDQQLVFTTEPTKAEIYVNGSKMGTTPCNILVPRRRPPPSIILKKEGYEDTPVVFTSKYNPWIIGNVLWGYCSLTAFTVDFNSDKSIMYYPDTFLTTLSPLEGTTPEQKNSAEKQKQKSKVVRFVAANYDALVLELSKGSGDHLTALFDLMEIPAANRENAVTKLKPLYIKYDNPVELGRAIELEFPR